MIGFLSTKNEFTEKVKSTDIYFLHIDDKLTIEEIKISCSKMALTFANLNNVDKVFLHTRKDTILYDYSV